MAVTTLNQIQGVLLASAARTVDTYSAKQSNIHRAKGVSIVVNISAASSPSILVKIQGYDEESDTWYQLNASPSALTGIGQTVYELSPGVGTAAGGITQASSRALPYHWRVFMDVADTNSCTYSVSYSYLF